MTNKIQLRRDTTANWARVNPILDDGEPGLDITTNQIKYGDGSTAWSDLAYAGGGSGGGDSIVNGAYSVSVGADGVITMETSRGNIEFGALPEIGGPSHFHIMRAAGEDSELFFGDDFNYVRQRPAAYSGSPAYGVEIGSNDMNSGSQQVWRFGTDGILTMPPGNETTAGWIQWSHASDDLTNVASAGFVDYFNAYTGLGLSAPTNTNAEKGIWFGTPADPTSPFQPETSMVFRNDTLYLPKNGFIKSHDINRVGYANLTTVGTTITIQTNDEYDWVFGTDGTLTLPNGLTFSSGAQIFEQADHIGAAWATGLNIRGSSTNDPIRIYTYGDDSKGYNAAGIVVNQHSVDIYGNSLQPSSPGTKWTFGSDGSTTLPLGGTVKETQFVSGGGIGGGDLQGTLALTPNGAYNPWNNLTIYNTAFNAETQHLHLTSGDLNRTEIVLGDDNKFVKVNLDGSVCVQSSRYYLYNLAGTSGGSSTVISYANLDSIVSVGDYIIDAHGNAYQITGVTGTDPNWTIATNWASLTPLLASPYSFYKPTSTGGLWQFGSDGRLATPGQVNIVSADTTDSGAGFAGILKLTNNNVGATNINKSIRLKDNGNLQIIDSSYSNAIFDLSDSGDLTLKGSLLSEAGTGPVTIQSNDGSNNFTWNFNSTGSISLPALLSGAQGNGSLDANNNAVTLALNDTVDFHNFSGMILVNSHNGGNVTLYLCGGGTGDAVAIGSSKGTALGSLAFNSGIGGYTFTASESGVHVFCAIRTGTGG